MSMTNELRLKDHILPSSWNSDDLDGLSLQNADKMFDDFVEKITLKQI